MAQVPCPYCAEPIEYGAKKCPKCNEWLDPSMRQRASGGGGGGDVMPSVVDWILCILCPLIAFIIGIVALTRGESKRGGIMMGVSAVMMIIGGIVQASKM